MAEWHKGLQQRGNYFEGVIDGNKLDETLELHRRSTVSTFGTRRSCRAAVVTNKQVAELHRRSTVSTFGTRRSCRAAVVTNKQVANSENVRYAVFRMQHCVLIIKNVKRHN